MGLIRQITVCLAIGVAVTFVTVSSMTVWMADRHNQEAAAATRTMVIGGLSASRRRLEAFTNDYAWWEEGFQAYARGDREWIDGNFGSGVTDTQIADTMVILSPKGLPEYGWNVDGEVDPKSVLPDDVLSQVREMVEDVPVDRSAARSLIARVDDGVLVIGAAPITPVESADTVDRATLPLLVMSQFLNEHRLGELGASFLLKDLSIAPAPPHDGHDSLVLNGSHGGPVAYLIWTPPQPGGSLLKTAFVPLAAALAIFCVAMLLIGLRARMMALSLSRSEQRAIATARHDHLTGLLNRMGLNEVLLSKASRQAATRGEVATIYVDVNGFKAVNDSVGHYGGDALVREIAVRFRSSLPASAHLARVGGDEFVIVLLGSDARGVVDIASTLPGAMETPFVVSGVEFHVSCAVGYAVSADSGYRPEELIRQADMAMYQAKATGQREPARFESSMDTDALETKQFEGRLWNALQEGELSVVYQPIARTQDMKIVGLEALVRWYSPVDGQVSPAKLVAVAEESGLIREIGDFVLDRVCADLHLWPDLRVSVNVSPVQLRDPNYIANFKAILARHDVDPSRIEIELTENILVSDPVSAAEKLKVLRALGTTVALDDFGTGFSSIGYLRTFPFDRVKIDRSFVQEIGLENSVLHSLIALADAMKLSVVAEGVETAEQARLLGLTRCELFQGYFLSRPASPLQIRELLDTAVARRAMTPGAIAKAC